MSLSTAIILAGGQGTRLRKTVPEWPKPLAPVQGRPFLDHQLDWLVAGGVHRVIITAHYMANKILDYAKARSDRLPEIDVIVEENPLGTGGAVKNAFDQTGLSGSSAVLNGDTLYNFSLSEITSSHATSSCPITLAIASVPDSARFGTVEYDNGHVTAFLPASGSSRAGIVSCGVYAIDQSAMADAPRGAFSMEADFFTEKARAKQINACLISAPRAFLDIGTPDSYIAINKRLDGVAG